jgi:hypothetical protein
MLFLIPFTILSTPLSCSIATRIPDIESRGEGSALENVLGVSQSIEEANTDA